jgi:protein ImuB
MLWIALCLHQLPLDLACRRWPEPLRQNLERSMPLAVTEARRIGWANACARDAGIVPGMHESSALARAADIVFIPRDPGVEADAVMEAALWALHFTPQVSLLPNGLLLNVSASLRLFGGPAALVERLRGGVLELGFTPQLASAPTAAAAWLFAQHADGLHGDGDSFAMLLERLPVALMLSVQAHLDTLRSIGCQTIGQLRRLPRTGITRRFGGEVLSELDRAFGAEPEICAWVELPATFSARLELPSRVDTTDALLFAARRLLMQMTGWLVARHAAVSRFVLLLHHGKARSGGSGTTTLAIALGSASRDLAHLTLLLQEHLAKVALSDSVIELSLQAEDVQPLAAPNTELFPTAASQSESMVRLIERLESRLGQEAISRLTVMGDHRPERCSVPVAAHRIGGGRKARAGQGELLAAFPTRPAWLLRQPLALLVRGDRPFYQSPLTILAGPERIEAGWWDDELATRDYFIACNDAHLLLWVYRERQGAGLDEPGWFLHGFF